MPRVIIADDRARWMKKEDKHYVCQTFCKLYKRCTTRAGNDCKRMGGDVIPKIRGD